MATSNRILALRTAPDFAGVETTQMLSSCNVSGRIAGATQVLGPDHGLHAVVGKHGNQEFCEPLDAR